jgi:hypothetical protein
MSKYYRWIVECANSHAEHGDDRGAEAIMFALRRGKKNALQVYPEAAPAIDNAFQYGRQEYVAANGGAA